jgi:hypothetical protein
MAYDNYMQYYRATTISKYKENYECQSLWLKHGKNSYSLAEFTLNSKSKVYICTYQYNKRLINASSGYTPSFCKIFFSKLDDFNKKQPMEYIEGEGYINDRIYLEPKQPLDAGRYIILVEHEWKFPDKVYEFSLSVYAPEIVDLKPV